MYPGKRGNVARWSQDNDRDEAHVDFEPLLVQYNEPTVYDSIHRINDDTDSIYNQSKFDRKTRRLHYHQQLKQEYVSSTDLSNRNPIQDLSGVCSHGAFCFQCIRTQEVGIVQCFGEVSTFLSLLKIYYLSLVFTHPYAVFIR